MRSAQRTLAKGAKLRLLPGSGTGVKLQPGFYVRGFTSRPTGTIRNLPPAQGLYDPANERDNCGVGMIANLKKTESHRIVKNALQVSPSNVCMHVLVWQRTFPLGNIRASRICAENERHDFAEAMCCTS